MQLRKIFFLSIIMIALVALSLPMTTNAEEVGKCLCAGTASGMGVQGECTANPTYCDWDNEDEVCTCVAVTSGVTATACSKYGADIKAATPFWVTVNGICSFKSGATDGQAGPGDTGLEGTPGDGSAPGDGGTDLELPDFLGLKNQDPNILINRIIKVIIGVVGSLALAIFVYGGILWMTSAGNEKRVTDGKNAMLWAVIGLVVIFFAYTVVSFILLKLTT